MKYSKSSITENRRHQLSLFRKIAGVLLSAAIIILLYSKLDIRELRGVLNRFDVAYLTAVIGTFFLIFLLSAWRWKMMANPYLRLSLFRSLSLTGTASCLNIILPSKMGTFIKAYGMSADGGVKTKLSVSMVIYEKLLDLAVMGALFLIFMFMGNRYNTLIFVTGMLAAALVLILTALHVVPRFPMDKRAGDKRPSMGNRLLETVAVVFTYAQSKELRQAGIIKVYLVTVLTWMIHSIQMVLFFRMIGLQVPPVTLLGNMYSAVFMGLIPITVAGIGTRDLSIVYLFSGILTYSESLSIGIISTLRYIVPMIIGAPFFLSYVFSKDRIQVKKAYSLRT